MLLVVAAAAVVSARLCAGHLRLWRERRQTASWRGCALHAGLEAVESHPYGVAAKLGTLTVTIEAHGAPGLWNTRGPSRAHISFRWAGCQDLVAVAKPRQQDDVVAEGTGDEEFDRFFEVEGSVALRRALLDHRTRRGLLALVAVLRGERETLDPGDARHLATSGADLAGPGGVAGPDDVAARIAENTRREPLASVRAANMRQLAESFTDQALTRELARTLVKDVDPWARLEAANTLPEEGRAALVALTRDEAVREDCAVEAVRRLGSRLSRAEIRSGVEQAMGQGRWELATALKKRLGAVIDSDDVRAVSAALTRWGRRLPKEATDALDQQLRRLDAEIERREIAEAKEPATEGYDPHYTHSLRLKRDQLLEKHGLPIAAALAATLRRAPTSHDRDKALLGALTGPGALIRLAAAQGLVSNLEHLPRLWGMPELAAALGSLQPADFPAAEEVLIAALAHPEPDVLRTAVTQLGGASTRRAIAALRECAQAQPDDRDIRDAIRQAIAEIQSRLPGASPGQLSIAGAGAGQVSLAEEDRRGQVSLEKS